MGRLDKLAEANGDRPGQHRAVRRLADLMLEAEDKRSEACALYARAVELEPDDIIAAGMFINPKRCEQVQFSEPSYGIGQAFLVADGNPKGINDYGTVAEKSDLKLAVMAGAVEKGYA